MSAAVRVHEKEADAGVLDVKFHDTGVGIPREHLRRIFDPFFSRRADGGMGSGLGLPVSLSMVKSIGGDVQIASAEGIGTTVTVSLPILERRAGGRCALRRTGGRALVVDDDPDVRRTLTTLLTRRGFEVVTAADGEEAATRFEEAPPDRPFDLVLTELVLPKVDGPATTRRIRALSPHVPVVVLTGVTDPRRMGEALESGAQFGFSKPPDFRELIAVVEQLMGLSNAAPGQAAPDDAGDGAAPG